MVALLNGMTKEMPRREVNSKVAGIDVGRYARALENSQHVLRRMRQERREIVRQMLGAHYSEDGARYTVPLNLLAIYNNIVSRTLIPKEPRAMLATDAREAQPIVKTMESWMNKRIVQIGLAETLQRWLQDALMFMGVLKISLASPADAALTAFSGPAGEPYCEYVDLDDFGFDAGCTSLRNAGFVANRIRVPLDAAQEYYGKKGKKLLRASPVTSFNPGTGEERTSNLGRGTRAAQDECEDMTEIWEMYLPRHHLVICLATDESGQSQTEPLSVKRWIGPKTGPYEYLTFWLPPGNAIGKGPMLDLVDLHMNANHVSRLVMQQAVRQKTNLAISGGQVDEQDRLIQAGDGEAVKYEGEPPTVIEWGGANPQNVAFLQILRDLFSWGSGNLDIMGGLSPQSKTATQDQMLNQNASMTIASMQETTSRGVSAVLNKLGWFFYHHPKQVMRTKYSPPGLPEVSTVRQLHPYNPSNPDFPMLRQQGAMMREVPWEDIDLRCDPYSLRHQTPQQRSQELVAMLKELGPLLPIAFQQGYSLSMDKLIALLAKYRDQPDLLDIIQINQPPVQEGAAPEQPGMPQSTERTYTRRSMGGDQSEGSQMNDAMNLFASEASNDGE